MEPSELLIKEVPVPCISEDACIAKEISKVKITDLDEDAIELPSKVTHKFQIFMPKLTCNKKECDPRIYGKWMWFSNGDFHLQDEIWLKFQPLLKNVYVILMESSTARKSRQGVIKCYTYEDVKEILQAGLDMYDVVRDDSLLYYKTEQASEDGLNRRRFHDRFIDKYMLSANGKFYEKDYLDRWKRIRTDGCTFETSTVQPLAPHIRQQYIDSDMLPSEETKKEKYVFSTLKVIFEPIGVWHLFCDVTVLDINNMTELDRVWITLKSMYKEGVFVSIAAETNAYFYRNNDANFLRRTVTCCIKDFRDVVNVRESGRKLLERSNYSFPIYLKTVREGERRYQNKFYHRYLLAEDELYAYTEEKWKLVKAY